MIRWHWQAWVVGWALLPLIAAAQSVGTTPDISLPNVPLPTFGGEQFWSDELIFRGWRIQQNVWAGHYRLLDPKDIRRAWGTFEQCQAALDSAKRRDNLPPLAGPAVITLHGLIKSRDDMQTIGDFLEDEGHYHWVNVSYASTRRTLEEHAQSLARIIDGLDGINEINFVCHSLGNLVVRRYLGEERQAMPRWRVDPRIKRMVMLGPPNNGAQVACWFRDNDLYGMLMGPSGKQLACYWHETESLLATPAFEFGIIAGGRADQRGANPLLAGDDDFVVSVAETRLPGASDFRIVPCLHGRILDDPGVHQYAVSFLKHGYFTTADARQPIPALVSGPPARDAVR
jgi:hypothetical protein